MSASVRAVRAFTRATASIACSLMLACSWAGCGPIKPDCYDPAHNACTGKRWVGILKAPANACPTVAGWTSQKLFPPAPGSMTLPAALAQYCLFTWSPSSPPNDCSSGPSNTEVANLQKLEDDPAGNDPTKPLRRLEEDCNVVVPQQTQTLEEAMQNQLRSPFEKVAGRVAPLPQGIISPVRIAVIDTFHNWNGSGAMPAPSVPPAGSHGHMMASHANDLACPGGPPCAGKVETWLGLGLDQSGSTVLPGSDGVSGSPSQLAVAINAAVNQWRVDVLNNGEKRLVINISAGWNHGAGGHECSTTMADADAPARAVYDAARYAACHGAVVLASAGNATGGPNQASGLMCPALLESEALPSDLECGELRGTTFTTAYQVVTGLPLVSASTGVYKRIVYAVGGADPELASLRPLRPNARPRIETDGWGAVLPDGQDPTPFYGTSIASIVATASVAVRWAYEPGLTYPEVMDSVYNAGASVNAAASTNACFAGTGSCGVRHVSVCHALKAVFPSLPCSSTAPMTMDAAALTPYFAGIPVQQVTASFSPSTPNPLTQYPTIGSGTFVVPQPNWPECPACFFTQQTNNGDIYVYVSPPTGVTLKSLTLVSASGAVLLSSNGVNTRAVFKISNAPNAGKPWLTWQSFSNGPSSYTLLPKAQ